MIQEALQSALNYALTPRIVACVAGMWTENNRYCLPLHTAAGVILASGSRVLVLHLSRPKHLHTLSTDTLAFGELLQALETPLNKFIIFYNTSLCSTLDDVKQVMEMMRLVRSVPPLSDLPAFLKLEILDKDLRPDDDRICNILNKLPPESRRICIPLMIGNDDSIQQTITFGCPAIRIWCSDIGRCEGINDEYRLKHILSIANIPLILEGGLSTPQDVQRALLMGFNAVLMNSAFRLSPNPIKLASEIKAAIDMFSGSQNNTSGTYPPNSMEEWCK